MPLCHPENNACGLQLSAERKGELLPKVGCADRLLYVSQLTRQTFAKRVEAGGAYPRIRPLRAEESDEIFLLIFRDRFKLKRYLAKECDEIEFGFCNVLARLSDRLRS